ncbi:MAG TPA: curli-like amyloid fiber formation chaperone CsgH [Methylovirgula sp.]
MRVLQSPIPKPHVSRPTLIGVALAFIAAPLAAAPTGGDVLAQAASGPLHCEIQKSQSGDMVRLVGIATGTQAIAGTSRFVMIKSGTSGSSNMAQSQHFVLKAQQQAVVGQATTNLDPGGHIAIDFGVRTDGGLVCNVRASLER